MRVRFWGTRGSIPAPGPGTVRYGGNTSCIEVRSAAGTLLVVDCGTGARPLGSALVAEAVAAGRPPDGHILIGHTHWDHIQGLPFFAPLFQPGASWHLYGPRGLGESLAQTLAGQMQYQYFPVSVDQLAAQVTFHDLVEGRFEIEDIVVHAQYLNHPALTLGYRIEVDGCALVYASDHEPHDPSLAGGGDLLRSAADARHVEMLHGADVLVHDAQYLAAEYDAKRGWGHSTVEYVLGAARAAEVGQVVLYHHDPWREDDELDAVIEQAAMTARSAGFAGAVLGAVEGSVIDLGVRERPARGATSGRSATFAPAQDQLAARVVLAVQDDALRAAGRSAAEAEGLEVLDVAGVGELTCGTDGESTTVLVVDREVVAALPPDVGAVAVVGATTTPPPLDLRSRVTDWLVWPATVGHVRTKLRAAVLGRACRWQSAPLAPDEDRRLRALHSLGLLDTPAEARFDRLTELARRALDVPVALVTLVDGTRQWFKSRQGIDDEESPRDESVCAHAILVTDVFQVPDLLADERFADSPAVAGPSRFRFYAGVPLVVDGRAVGTLCVVDHRPRQLGEDELQQLRTLAQLVQAELVERR